jgi:predicted nucleic acid-binding protein
MKCNGNMLVPKRKEDMDVLISGDKDFADIEIEKPEIMTPADFMAKYL